MMFASAAANAQATSLVPAETPQTNHPSTTNQEKKLKPCCACPETKKVRDAW